MEYRLEFDEFNKITKIVVYVPETSVNPNGGFDITIVKDKTYFKATNGNAQVESVGGTLCLTSNRHHG